MSDKTIIEKLAVFFGIDVDEPGFKQAIRTYTDFHNVAVDITNALEKLGRVALSPVLGVLQLGNEATLTSIRLGKNVERLQEFRHAAELSGVPVDSLTTAMERLGRSAYRLTLPGGPLSQQGRALGRLGINVFDANKQLKDTSVLMPEVIDKLGKVKNTAELDGIAFALMGRGAGQLLPLIRQGPGYLQALIEATRDTGVVLKEGAAKAARDVSFWFQILGLQAEGVKNRIGAGLLPIANDLVGTLLHWRERNKELINTKVDQWLTVVQNVSDTLFRGLKSLGKAVGDVTDFFGGFDNIIKIVAVGLGAGFLAIIGAATGQLLKFVATLALSSIGPLIFGALLATLFLVIQDLESTNSLIKRIIEYKVEPDHSPVVRFLTTIINRGRTIRDLWNDVAKINPFHWLIEYNKAALRFVNSEVDAGQRAAQQQHLAQWAQENGIGAPETGIFDPNNIPGMTNHVTVNLPPGVENPEQVRVAAKQGAEAGLKAVAGTSENARRVSWRNSLSRSGGR